MKFGNVTVENFLTISRAMFNLTDRGLNVIQGINDEDSSATSNGSGKSSLVDALCWVLFGVTARGVKGDRVVNRTAKKNCVVSVDVLHGETRYTVVRHRKHATGKNALHLQAHSEAGMLDLTKGTDALTQKEVERIIGCSLNVFMAAVYSGQEAMPDLPRMTDGELKRLIEEAAGLERIELAYEQARAAKNMVADTLTSLNVKQSSVEARIARDEANLEMMKQRAEKFREEQQVKIESANNKMRLVKGKLQLATEELVLAELEVIPFVERGKEIDASLKEHSLKERDARQAHDEALVAEAKISKPLLDSCRDTVVVIQTSIDNADEEMKEPCSECGKPHTEADKDKFIARRQRALADAKDNLRLVEERVRSEVANVKALRIKARELAELVPDVSALSAEREVITAKVKVLSDKAAECHALKLNSEAVERELAQLGAATNTAEVQAGVLIDSIKEEVGKLAEIKQRIEAAQKELDIANEVVTVFGPGGVRAHIIDTVTPFLNERTSDYLSAMSDGAITAVWNTLTRTAAGDLREKFSIEVTHEKGGDSFLELSGGEKRKVRLATALALQDLVASRAAQPIDLWIGDEVDDALDPAGLERLMVILERRARERGTVLVISHNDLSDWCDLTTTVRKGEAGSTVEGSLCI